MAKGLGIGPWLPCPYRGVLPPRVVEPCLMPACRCMNRGLPSRSAGKGFRGSIRILDKQSCTQRGYILLCHSVWVGYIMNGLDGDNVRAGFELAGCLGTQVLLPRHLFVGRHRICCKQLSAVDPSRNGVLPGGKEGGLAHGLGKLHRLPVGEALLRRLIGGQSFCVRAGNPCGFSVANSRFSRRFEADPFSAPLLRTPEARFPPTDGAIGIRLARRVPNLPPPEVARLGPEGRSGIMHVQRLVRLDAPAVAKVRLALLQQLWSRSYEDLVGRLPGASRWILQLP